jgi:putative Holliday junction resolvase
VSASSDQGSAPGRILAIDLGAKRVGLAISDELRITVKPLKPLERGSWKRLLQAINCVVIESDVRALVIGLPLRLEGTEGDAAASARGIAEKFRRSLSIPVHLQDERLTTFAATKSLREAGRNRNALARQVDSEAAAIILRDFINQERT